MLGLEAWSIDYVPVLGDELHDGFDRLLGVTEAAECAWDRLVDDLHRATTNKFLELNEREVWFNARGVAVHHEPDGAGRCKNGSLRIAPAVLFADFECLLPLTMCDLHNRSIESGNSTHIVVS